MYSLSPTTLTLTGQVIGNPCDGGDIRGLATDPTTGDLILTGDCGVFRITDPNGAVPFFSEIIAGNFDAANVLRRKGYTGPMAIFSVHGVDPDIYRPLPRASPSSTFVIGYLGRLVMYKGVGLLIEALQGMPDHCRLRLVGSGQDERALRRIATERGVAERVEFVSAIATADVPCALADMDVLAAPSLTQPNWKEQFGRVLIEAMACGIPVIGSASGEIPHVIGSAGMIVPEGDVEALRVGLLRLVNDAAMRERFSRAGRARVQELFTQEQVARKTVAVYHEALGHREARK